MNDFLCYDCASNLSKERLMLKYAQDRSINHHDLTRFDKVETRRTETRFIYIDYFDLHVFLFFLILIY